VICPRLKENLFLKKNGATINQPKKKQKKTKICCLSSTHVIILIHISSIRIDNEENSTYTAAQTEGFFWGFFLRLAAPLPRPGNYDNTRRKKRKETKA
jgi:hypothetical protein